jgi:hypothetical protein
MQAEESEVLRSEAAAFQNEKAKTEENDVVRVAAPAASEEAAAKEGCPLHIRCLPHTYLPLLVGDYDYDYDDDYDDDDDDETKDDDDDDDDGDDDDDDADDDDETVSPPLLVARVQVARYSGKTLPVSAEICFLRSGATGQRWRWTLSNRSFEAVHLLSRVARMTADKVLTASLLNLDNLRDPGDEGGFLIRQLEDLAAGSGSRLRELRALEAAELTLRRQRAGLPEPSPPTEGEERHDDGLRGENCLEFSTGAYGFLTSEQSPVQISGPERSLDQVVDWFASRLVGFREFLARRPGPSRVSSWAEATVEMAAEILACCQAYLHFVHPVWRELEETGGMTRARHEELAFAATRKVEASRKLAFDGVSFDVEENTLRARQHPAAPDAGKM